MSVSVICYLIAGPLWLWVLVGTVLRPEQRTTIRRVTVGLLAAAPLIGVAGWWWVAR